MDTEPAALIAVACVQALATVVLVGVTWTYARSSRQQADAAIETARLARESVLSMFRPVITVRVWPIEDQSTGMWYLRLVLKNDGKGRAAVDAAECCTEPEMASLTQQRPPGPFIDAGDETDTIFELPAKAAKDALQAIVIYNDVFNRGFITTQKFQVRPDDRGNLAYVLTWEEHRLLGKRRLG